MGGARQNVQRIVNELRREELLDFIPNPPITAGRIWS